MHHFTIYIVSGRKTDKIVHEYDIIDSEPILKV